MMEFKHWHGLLCVHGVINNTHISISKPKPAFAKKYYYHKSGSYPIVAHVVVDVKMRFTNLYVGLPRSINDFQVLWKSKLYKQAQHQRLFNLVRGSEEGFAPYLFGDNGYSLFPWIMIPHKEG